MPESNITLASFFDIVEKEQEGLSTLKNSATVKKLKKSLKLEAKKYKIPANFEEKNDRACRFMHQ